MRLDELKSLGGFVDAEPVKKRIEWRGPNGQQHAGDVFVVRQPFGVVERAVMSNDKDRSQGARLISLCIRLGDNADEQLNYEQAYNLTPALAWAFVGAINDVNDPKS